MDIVVFGNTYQSARADDLRSFFLSLGGREGVRLKFERSFRDYFFSIAGEMPIAGVISADTDFDADLVLSLGGDGTFLHTAEAVAPRQIPIMGINTGHLGYLSASSLSPSPGLVEDIVGGKYIVENRAMLKVSSSKSLPQSAGKHMALNEIVVERSDRASMLEACAFIDGRYLATYMGDGLIIATPTGSTAYNLSAGGPILAPNAPSWVLTPVAPHTLNMRPIVVDYNTEIRLKLKSRTGNYKLSIDGHCVTLPVDTEIMVSRAPFVTKLVRTPDHTFIDTLRTKLLWGMSPR